MRTVSFQRYLVPATNISGSSSPHHSNWCEENCMKSEFWLRSWGPVEAFIVVNNRRPLSRLDNESVPRFSMHLKEVTNNANVVSGAPSFHNCIAANPCATANPRPPSNAVRPSLSIDKHHNSFSHIHERTLALPCLQRFIPYNGVYPKATWLAFYWVKAAARKGKGHSYAGYGDMTSQNCFFRPWNVNERRVGGQSDKMEKTQRDVVHRCPMKTSKHNEWWSENNKDFWNWLGSTDALHWYTSKGRYWCNTLASTATFHWHLSILTN